MPRSRTLETLRADHRHFARLLELLYREQQRLRGADAADLTLLLDAVEYFEVYPDRVHHPREDVVLEAAAARDAQAAELARQLREEHESLARLTQSLRRRVEDALRDAAVEREPLAADLQHFIERQAAHMDEEEGRIFPRLEELLSVADWERIERGTRAERDPLFEGEVARYRALRARVLGGS